MGIVPLHPPPGPPPKRGEHVLIAQRTHCIYCGNGSSLTDRRGCCISCGAPMPAQARLAQSPGQFEMYVQLHAQGVLSFEELRRATYLKWPRPTNGPTTGDWKPT